MYVCKKMFTEYWKGLSEDEKKKQYVKISAKYKDHIPVVILNGSDIEIEKNKYLVNGDITIGQFMYTLRNKIKIKKEEAVFLFLESGELPPNSELVSVIYERSKSECGFLILDIKKESVFG